MRVAEASDGIILIKLRSRHSRGTTVEVGANERSGDDGGEIS